MDPEWPPVKPQSIRVLDIFVIGPLMVLGARALQEQGRTGAALALGLFGLGTIAYNAKNYAVIRERTR